VNETTERGWLPADYCLSTATDQPDESLAVEVYDRLCRTDFAAPGFCLIDLGPEFSSPAQRRFMVALKRSLQVIHELRAGRGLVFVSLARFDQQLTTKPHRDGGPDECFLMLGYEPSPVSAEVVLSDYARCAHDLRLTPGEMLARYNPMFRAGEDVLRPYTTRVACISNRSYQVLLINNSIAAYAKTGGGWQGVLHTATIHNPADAQRRVVNSIMIASVPLGEAEPVSTAEQVDFMTTSVVRRRGYDKGHLEDDR
jgi:hypothetical protein